jgi:hypothetical protein
VEEFGADAVAVVEGLFGTVVHWVDVHAERALPFWQVDDTYDLAGDVAGVANCRPKCVIICFFVIR